jgi:hypothetical protein
MEYNKTEIERARAAFEVAKKELSRASAAYEAKKADTKKACDMLRGDAKNNELHNAVAAASEAEGVARRDLNIVRAVYILSGENVAAAAGNLLLLALADNEKIATTPIHYKKFEKFFYNVLGDDFYYCNSDHGFYIYYKHAEYRHNNSYVCWKRGGVLELPEVINYKHIATFEELREECTRAAAFQDKLNKELDRLRLLLSEEKKEYKTGAAYLLPSVHYRALETNFDF